MQQFLNASRLKRLINILIFCGIINLNFVYSQNDNSDFPSVPSEDSTINPSDLRTGKLNQFSGFFTPRPLPANANFVYASIWASWSAWSFCANNVQVRVRACNTVRGFTCPGPNQERKPCAQTFNQNNHPRFHPNNDYDAIDPWEEDRREAVKQLYSDYTPPEFEKSTISPRPMPNFGFKKHLNTTNDFKSAVIVQKSAGKTVNVNGSPLMPLPINENIKSQSNYGSPVPLPVHQNPSMNLYASGVGAPVPPPRDENFRKRQFADGPGEAPSMTPELLFGSKLEIPSKKIKTEIKEQPEENIEGIDSEINNSKEKELTNGLQKIVPSNETNQSPLKIGLKTKQEKFEGDILEFPDLIETTTVSVKKEKFDDKNFGETESAVDVWSETATPLTEELETMTHELDNVTPTAEIVTPQLPNPSLKSNLETTNIKSFAIESENKENLDKTPKSTDSGIFPESDSEGQMYDDEVEPSSTTTKSPQETWKELEQNIEQLEKETGKVDNSKLHSGEVVFNPDTEKALNWLIANMTKATELALSDTDGKSSVSKENALIEENNDDKIAVHSGEVIYPKKLHSGERFRWNVAFSSKTKHLVPIKPQRLDAHKYDNAKMLKSIKIEMESTTVNPAVENDLKFLKNEMLKMKNEIERLEEESQIRTTISPSLLKGPIINAMDFDVVPKPPKIESGPLPAVIGSGDGNGDVFMLDGFREKTVAQWSDWRDWNECFCDKQVRTRICNYDSGFHSKGCTGKSFETRSCFSTKPCPAKIAEQNRLKLKLATTSRSLETDTNNNGVYTLAPHRGPRTGYAFKPHPLSEAISRIQTFQ